MKTLGVNLTADPRDLQSGLAAGSRYIQGFAGQAAGAFNMVASRATGMAVVISAATIAVVAGLQSTIAPAIEFERQMRNANSIMKLTETQFRATADEVIRLSTEIPEPAAEMARGLYDIASAGFAGADATTILEASTRAAAAGMTDTATSARAIVSVLRAYGFEADRANEVSDILFQTVNLGIITFEELAHQLGDVVGLAAAAKIQIDDVGAALAAITLAGIPAPEATTSLNRVIQSLIEPSEALSATFRSMNMSQQNVLDTLAQEGGLLSVMEKLRHETGGNVAVLLQLFPEIRSARGAFALMADAGENYRETQSGISDEQKRANATQRAFNEQMRATGNQLTLVVNRARALGQETGAKLLPLVETLGTAFGALLVPLAEVVQFLGDNHEIVLLLTAAILSRAIPAMVGWGVSIAGSTAQLALNVLGVKAAGVAYVGLATTIAAAAAQFALLAGVAVVGFGLASLRKAQDEAQKLVDTLKEGLDLGSREGQQTFAAGLQTQLNNLLDSGQRLAGDGGFFEALDDRVRRYFDPNMRRASAQADALSGALEDLSTAGYNTAVNIDAIAVALGVRGAGEGTSARLREFAAAAGVDLSGSLEDSAGEREKLLRYMESLEAQTGVTIEQLTALGPDILEKMKETADAAKKIGEQFASVFDAFSNLEMPDAGDLSDDVVEATDRLADAEERLLDAQQKVEDNQRFAVRTPERDRELAKARREVADAEKDIADARKELNKAERESGMTPEERYKEEARGQLEVAEQFLQDIATLGSRGVDPGFLLRAMGDPEQFGPILQAMVQDADGSFINVVNNAERELRRLQGVAASQAELIKGAMDQGLSVLPDIVLNGLTKALTYPVDKLPKLVMTIGAEVRAPGASTGEGEGENLDAPRGERALDVKYGTDSTQRGGITEERGRRRRAKGGIDPHIAYSPTVLYGERSTGGEAFIPLGLNNRSRSVALLGEVAHMFGMQLNRMDRGGVTNHSVAHNYNVGPVYARDWTDTERQLDRRRRLSELVGSS